MTSIIIGTPIQFVMDHSAVASHTLTAPASDNPGAEIIQHAGQGSWGVVIAPQQSVGGEGVAVVAEVSLFLILVQQIPLCPGDGSSGISL